MIDQERDGPAFHQDQQRSTSFEGKGRLSGREGNRRHADRGRTWWRTVELRIEQSCCSDGALGRLLGLEMSRAPKTHPEALQDHDGHHYTKRAQTQTVLPVDSMAM